MKIENAPFHYIGNKTKRLPQILPHLPKSKTFIDVFGGSGTVGINAYMQRLAKQVWYNDGNEMVANLFRFCVGSNDCRSYVDYYNRGYDDSEPDCNKEEIYRKLRADYNALSYVEKRTAHGYAMLLILMYRSFNNDIRFNSKGEFNLPYGKRNYFNKRFNDLPVNNFNMSFHISSEDFSFVMNHATKDDVVFLDPPYLNTTATYNTGWTERDELRLLSEIDKLSMRGVKWILTNTFKNRGNENKILVDWFDKSDYTGIPLKGSYGNSSYFKSDEPTVEMLIKNF